MTISSQIVRKLMQAIALLIGAGGLVLGVARLIISVLSYRLDARRDDSTDQQLVKSTSDTN